MSNDVLSQRLHGVVVQNTQLAEQIKYLSKIVDTLVTKLSTPFHITGLSADQKVKIQKWKLKVDNPEPRYKIVFPMFVVRAFTFVWWGL
jgi:hypothetical protein